MCLVCNSLTATAGSSHHLDPTFGVLGKVVSSPDGSETVTGSDMALQADGKIIRIGNRTGSAEMIVARYNSNGSLDTTFGNNGWTSVTFGWETALVSAVGIQPDGKIVIGGSISIVENNQRINNFAIARFNPDGSLDTTFDGDGRVTISFPGLEGGALGISDLHIADDGKILVVGSAFAGINYYRYIAAKLNPDGSLVTAFGTNGKFIDESFGFISGDLADVAFLPDGTFVVVGNLRDAQLPPATYRIAIKYGINGGRVWTRQVWNQGQSNSFRGISVLPDGKFIVVGAINGTVGAFRLNSDGTSDTTFNTPPFSPTGTASRVAIQADGKILATISIGNDLYSLIRYNPDGMVDHTFGNNGIVTTDVSDGVDGAGVILIQPDGKILVGGSSILSSPTRRYLSMVRYMGEVAVPDNPSFDYDGDGRSDVSVFRPSDGVWYLNQSTNGFSAIQFGVSTDKIVPADYDGDGKTDIAVYRDGVWWILQSSNGVVKTANFGSAGDKPQTGDFDNDGRDDLAVFRPSNSFWYVTRSSDNGSVSTQFGLSDDIPQSADYDGDGKADLAIFRPSTGDWWYAASSAGGQHRAVRWGVTSDIRVPADYDGDGKTDFAVFRPSDGGWYILYSTGGYTSIQFGVAEDKPVAADYDGDGKTDIAVFRPSAGIWYLLQTTSGFSALQWGVSGDVPTQNAFIP